MKMRYMIFGLMSMLLITTCGKEVKVESFPNPGFGFNQSSIHQRDGMLPLLLAHDQPIKGVQFTLRWDPSQLKLETPLVTESNSEFTVSANPGTPGRMKVLLFSFQGGELDLTDSQILQIPYAVTSQSIQKISIQLEDVVFAGPAATSYEIPVSQGDFEVSL